MKITRTSVFSGKTRTLDFPITEDQMRAYNDGALIQDAFPHLTPDQREFILTGTWDDEWDTFVKEDPEGVETARPPAPGRDGERHKNEYPDNMQKVGEALGLFREDGTLKDLGEIMEEQVQKFMEEDKRGN